jgi:hypothetical protein
LSPDLSPKLRLLFAVQAQEPVFGAGQPAQDSPISMNLYLCKEVSVDFGPFRQRAYVVDHRAWVVNRIEVDRSAGLVAGGGER